MSEAAQTHSPSGFGLARSAGLASALRRELLGWAWLAVGALAVAGAFAFLLALSRTPGMDKAPFWPIGFFYKGLVIHVVFSLAIWLLTIFAFLTSYATLSLAGEDTRAAALGRLGQGAVLVAFPCLFAPAFLDATQPELGNYIPLIRHPAYDLGLLALAVGILAPVGRLAANLPGRRAALPPVALAMSVGGFIYCVALLCFAIAGVLLARTRRPRVLTRAVVMGRRPCAAVRLRDADADELVDPRPPQPGGEGCGRPHLSARGPLHRGAFDCGAGLLCRVSAVFRGAARSVPPAAVRDRPAFAPRRRFAARQRPGVGRPSGWPWRDPAFFALAMSLALFALGGVMGFLITGSDMRTPAHYHAVITAVSVSSVGMLLTFGLDELGRGPASAKATRILIGLYGGGQFVASIAMFVAGGYGAARKTPDGVGSLDAVAAAGMAVHGVASIFTIIGGAAFIVVAVRALWRPALARAES